MPDKTVREAMTASPKVVSSDTTVVDAARAMTTENVGSLPIVDEQKLVGIVTDRDLVTNVLAKDPAQGARLRCGHGESGVRRPRGPMDAALQRMAESRYAGFPSSKTVAWSASSPRPTCPEPPRPSRRDAWSRDLGEPGLMRRSESAPHATPIACA